MKTNFSEFWRELEIEREKSKKATELADQYKRRLSALEEDIKQYGRGEKSNRSSEESKDMKIQNFTQNKSTQRKGRA